jgi:D-xylulose reductase
LCLVDELLTVKSASFALRAVKDNTIEDRPKPELKDPYDVIVHVVQIGICGSDVSLLWRSYVR